MSGLTPWNRIAMTLRHEEADRVPLLLALTLHGAKTLGLSIREYYAKAEHVVEAQLRLQKRYGHDALMGFLYGALEYEAWGGEAVFAEDGPPNSGESIFPDGDHLDRAEPPSISECPGLQRALEVLRRLKAVAGEEIPVLGSMISPFSLPVMQLGFDRYLDLLFEDRPRFWRLMAINQAFSLAWGRAQLEAGATALAYGDPLASSEFLPPELYRETGFQVAQKVIPSLGGPVTIHLASGKALGSLDLLEQTGAVGVGVSCRDDIAEVKRRCGSKLAVIGNLNSIAMVSWTPQEAEMVVRDTLSKGGPGGGFILSDHAGEVPWAVSDDVIGAIAEAAKTWGVYPLREERV